MTLISDEGLQKYYIKYAEIRDVFVASFMFLKIHDYFTQFTVREDLDSVAMGYRIMITTEKMIVSLSVYAPEGCARIRICKKHSRFSTDWSLFRSSFSTTSFFADPILDSSTEFDDVKEYMQKVSAWLFAMFKSIGIDGVMTKLEPKQQKLWPAPLSGDFAKNDQAYEEGLSYAAIQIKEHGKSRVAVIGQDQLNMVIPYALALDGLSFRFSSKTTHGVQFTGSEKDSVLLSFNKGWVNGIMNAGYEIHDMGGLAGGDTLGPWYGSELQEVSNRRYPTVKVR